MIGAVVLAVVLIAFTVFRSQNKPDVVVPIAPSPTPQILPPVRSPEGAIASGANSQSFPVETSSAKPEAKSEPVEPSSKPAFKAPDA